MKAPIIDLQNVQTVLIVCGELVEKALIAVGIDVRKLQEKRGSRSGFNRTIQPEGFEQPLPRSNRLDSTSCNQASDERVQSKAALIGRKVATRALVFLPLTSVLTQQVEVVCKVCLNASFC